METIVKGGPSVGAGRGVPCGCLALVALALTVAACSAAPDQAPCEECAPPEPTLSPPVPVRDAGRAPRAEPAGPSDRDLPFSDADAGVPPAAAPTVTTEGAVPVPIPYVTYSVVSPAPSTCLSPNVRLSLVNPLAGGCCFHERARSLTRAVSVVLRAAGPAEDVCLEVRDPAVPSPVKVCAPVVAGRAEVKPSHPTIEAFFAQWGLTEGDVNLNSTAPIVVELAAARATATVRLSVRARTFPAAVDGCWVGQGAYLAPTTFDVPLQ